MPTDYNLSQIKALPNAGANNNTNVIDLGDSASPSERWRLGFIEIGVPALAGHTNTSANVVFDLFHSDTNNVSNSVVTSPAVQLLVPGVGSTGSAAATVKMPLPPAVKRYVFIRQTATANSNTGPNSNVSYTLRVA